MVPSGTEADDFSSDCILLVIKDKGSKSGRSKKLGIVSSGKILIDGAR